MSENLEIAELKEKDIPFLLDYWYNSDDEFLINMGVDLDLMPDRIDFQNMLLDQLKLPINARRSYCVIWRKNGKYIGHSNTNPTLFGDHAFMHLHIWSDANRNSGLGISFVKLSIHNYFKNLKLKSLYCQPMSNNKGPNKLLKRLNFKLIETKTCIPGSINYEQEVNLWRINSDQQIV